MKQTKLGFANPYQAGEGYALNELVYYNGGLKIVQTPIAEGTTATGAEFASPVAPEWDYSTFRVVNGTKKVALDPSAVASDTTRTLSMPDANVNLGSVITGLAYDVATHLLTLTRPTGASTISIPSLNVVPVTGNATVTAAANTLYVLTSATTSSTVTLALGSLGTALDGASIVVMAGTVCDLSMTGGSFVWETGAAIGASTVGPFTLQPGEIMTATRRSDGVTYLSKISRAVDPALFKLKNASGSGAYSFSSTATAARTINLPNGDVDLRYLPRSNYDTGNSVSGGGATISGTNMTLAGRVVVAVGSTVTASGGSGVFIGTNHPSLPGNGATQTGGYYCGFLVTNNTTIDVTGLGYAVRCAGGVVTRSSILGTDTWMSNVDGLSLGYSVSGMNFGLVRSSSMRHPTKHQSWSSVHGMNAVGSSLPTYGAELTTSLMRSTSSTNDKTLLAEFALSALHDASSFATADGAQTASRLFLPPATLGTKGAACHDVTVVLKQTSTASDSSGHVVTGACAILKRRINVYRDSTAPEVTTSVETVGTDFLVGGTTTATLTLDTPYDSTTIDGVGWGQYLLKLTPELLVDGTPVTRSVAVKVESTYIVNEWS